MKLILLSGGSGKRLWPLSNDTRSKQFLKVLRKPDGELESMVQRVWRQVEAAGMCGDAYVATGKGQLEILRNQLGSSAPIIVEPERRDTFPAIALAATYLYSIEGVSLQEVIAVMPVDPYVEDRFFAAVKQLDAVIRTSDAELALIGVKPTYPSEKYGYIVPETELPSRFSASRAVSVSRFAEKPNEATARMLIEQQALWNCGVFAFKLDTIINLLIERGLPIQYEQMLKSYATLPKISFDYEVVEKTKHIAALPYEGLWKDLGTWNTLTEEMEQQVIGKGSVSADSVCTHLVNELDIPVAVLGLSNVIVTASPDGILVADKSASPRIKELVDRFDQRPMYEERRWGSYRVLDFKHFPDGRDMLTKRICIHSGKNLSYQQHWKRDEIWTVVSGEGLVMLDGSISSIRAGDVLKIPAGTAHSVKALQQLEMVEVQTGSELVEEDVIRLCMDWEEIAELSRQG